MREKLDLTGKHFGELTAIRRVRSGKAYQSIWLCECSCGKQTEVELGNLRSGNSTSCGHISRQKIGEYRHSIKQNLIGYRFGRLTVIEETSTSCRWKCQCDCGNIHEATSSNLRGGKTKSCGCLKRELVSKMQRRTHTTHGLTGTREYDRARKNKRRELKRNLDSKWTYKMEQTLKSFFPACVVCGSTDRMTTDHVLPLSKGHGLVPGNAIRLCTHCNSTKRSRSLESLPEEMRKKIVNAAQAFEEHYKKVQLLRGEGAQLATTRTNIRVGQGRTACTRARRTDAGCYTSICNGGSVKTRYKFIHFEKGAYGWICKNTRRGDILGRVIHYETWRQYIFDANSNCAFSADCLTDIANFMTQLNTQPKGTR